MRAAAAIAAICLVACTPDFDAVSDVTDLRVLAVQAEPPEAQFDENNADPIEVHVLAVDPRTTTPIVLHGAICAPTDSHRCDEGPPFDDFGTTALTTTVSIDVKSVLLAQADDDLKGLGGIRVQYSFSVDHGDPRDAVYGSKILLYSRRGGTPNHNPAIASIRLSREGAPFGELVAGDTLQVPKDVEIGLRPVLTAASREDYVTTDLRGNPVSLKEQPRYSFFVAPGAEVDADTADEPLDGVAPPDGLSRITVHSLPATLWIVVRDGRGGESWATFPLDLTP
jgi:hypothetical protein